MESSHCITMMEAVNDGKDLHIYVNMPSIEVYLIISYKVFSFNFEKYFQLLCFYRRITMDLLRLYSA